MEAPASALSVQDAHGSDFFYGWDLLYRTVEENIEKKADVLIVLAHFLLTKHWKFRCIGIGDDKSLADNESGSELLPDYWNGDNAKYSLRYIHNNVLYLLLAHVTEDALIVNLLDVNTKNVSNLCITPESLVANLKGSIKQIMPTAAGIVERFRKELCEPVFAVKNSLGAGGPSRQQQMTSPVGTVQSSFQAPNPLFIEEERRRPGAEFNPHGFEPPTALVFPEVGRGDLDPLSGGFGNLYPFPHSPRPVRPNVPGQSGPNPDHAQPPNWTPDQYM